jgi:hypothetical protein
MNGDVIHQELMRLLARRGELTQDLEQTDLLIARYRGMFDVARVVNAPDAAAAPAGDSAPSGTSS